MSIRSLSKRLRAAANILDELLEEPGTPAVAKKLKTTFKKLHWTQRPENKARVEKQLRKALKARS